jgi:hypothetical protein
MFKLPTAQSRTAAVCGLACAIALCLVEGWYTPPAPGYAGPILGAGIVGFMFLARYIRERNGKSVVISAQVKQKISVISNIEVSMALLMMLTFGLALGLFEIGSDKGIRHWAFGGAIFTIIATVIVNVWTNREFKKIMS